MRVSQLALRTLREAPADAEVASHQLLVRAGYIRRVASGVYAYLPLGLKVLAKLSEIVRSELDAVGAQEILLPALHPLELWQRSGRDKSMADVLLSVEGKGGKFVLGPTHEEVVTTTMAMDLDSWRDLPVTVYQIQTKFRDEPRARFGLLRTREFIMADAYSFDADKASMAQSYRKVFDAYVKIFSRLQLSFVAVEAAAGAIGGDVNHEFMVASDIGEDKFASCPSGDYAANLEAARKARISLSEVACQDGSGEQSSLERSEMVEHHTPGRPGIDLVVEYFADQGLDAAGMLKCIAFFDELQRPTVVLVPGDREVRVPSGWRPFEDADFSSHPQLVKGYIGPMGLVEQGLRVVADYSVAQTRSWTTGSNRLEYHVRGALLNRDFTVSEWDSMAVVQKGDPCPNCGATMDLVRSVEAAHTFQLGLTYSSKLAEARFTSETGEEAPYWMGCYGVGVSRLLSVVAQESHDDGGLIWPPSLSPYDIHLVSLGAGRSPETVLAAEKLYLELQNLGCAVLYDDRDVSAGVKFADADLLGMPIQIIVGPKGLKAGIVERKDRRSGERREIPINDLAKMA